MTGFYLVDTRNDHTLFRGPRPDSLQDFQARKCQTVINLEVGFFEFFHGEAAEEDLWAEQSGVKLIHIPCSDWSAPTEDQVKEFINAVQTGLANGDVYFHCWKGVDRTGFMAACYRVLQNGWEFEKSIQEMFNLGFHKWPYQFPLGWVNSLRERCSK